MIMAACPITAPSSSGKTRYNNNIIKNKLIIAGTTPTNGTMSKVIAKTPNKIKVDHNHEKSRFAVFKDCFLPADRLEHH